jgi:hypothetical protein
MGFSYHKIRLSVVDPNVFVLDPNLNFQRIIDPLPIFSKIFGPTLNLFNLVPVSLIYNENFSYIG